MSAPKEKDYYIVGLRDYLFEKLGIKNQKEEYGLLKSRPPENRVLGIEFQRSLLPPHKNLDFNYSTLQDWIKDYFNSQKDVKILQNGGLELKIGDDSVFLVRSDVQKSFNGSVSIYLKEKKEGNKLPGKIKLF
ncbi:hypothetical protein B6U91_00155 [Candidatus Pacearchaeota archaeon ex4484_71]|nr:MAG: hypothetical protein B6U91_00155 [Candidatus Pacearchaeota archaeon ex4484_71]